MHPEISVIVPVYKAEKYLYRCIESILAQTFTNFELLLVNDGSPDNSGIICDEYAQRDNRIKVLHKQNGGVSTARNLGIETAIGDWITFIDADDYIGENFLTIPLDVTGDLLVQNYKTFGKDNISVDFMKSTIELNSINEFINNNICEQFLRVPWSKFFKRSIILDNGIRFIEGVKIGEDTIFVLDYLCHTKSVQFLSSANYMYRCNDEEDRIKYRLSAQKSVDIFNLFIERYEQLNAHSISFLIFSFAFFYDLMHPRERRRETRIWYRDKTVKRIYNLVSKQIGKKWRLRYFINKVCS